MPEKYQNEIEEILKGIEESGATVPSSEGQVAPDDLPVATEQPSPKTTAVKPSRWQSVTPGRLALAGFTILVLGLALNFLGWGWLVWIGLLVLAGAYLLFFVRPKSENRDKRWRGRSVESRSPSLLQRFKRWISE